jgi:IMP dehydrogenase
MLNIKSAYTFDDVLLIPKFSSIKSRSDVDLSVTLRKNIKLKMPIVSANMKNVTGPHMAKEIAAMGGLAILHRFFRDPVKDQIEAINRFKIPTTNVGVSVGVQREDFESISAFVDAGIKIVCVDVAHGDHMSCISMVNYIHSNFPHLLLIAGNVANPNGALRLAEAGADVIKVGVGPGSLCTTRVETGNGVPQLTAISEACDALDKFNSNLEDGIKIISDGGIKRAGDIVKALCFADCVMLGNVLAGTDEAPGDTITIDGKTYKQYAGSSTHKTNHVEGVSGLVPTKGCVENIIKNLLEGVRSGCSYQGVKNLNDLKNNPEFVLLSQSGLVESHPHSVIFK